VRRIACAIVSLVENKFAMQEVSARKRNQSITLWL
jgi:hypothetical protein